MQNLLIILGETPALILYLYAKIRSERQLLRIMPNLDFHPSGRHFLQIPGPSPVPDRILRAMSMPTIDHRGPEFAQLGLKVLADMRKIFQTAHPVMIYPASGTGAWEAALVNTLSPGDHVLMYETGHFAATWAGMARALGLEVEVIAGDWRTGADPARIEEALARDTAQDRKSTRLNSNHVRTSRMPSSA